MISIADIAEFLDNFVLDFDPEAIHWEPFWYLLVKNHLDSINTGSIRSFLVQLEKSCGFCCQWEKGAVFCGGRFVCQSAQQAGEQTVLLEAGGW